MKAYSVPLLLILWAIAAASGCNFNWVGVSILLICIGVSTYELAERYRNE